MPTITLDHVTRTFDNGRVVAIDDVSLTIEDGEFIFLLGPSGCGKTTLLRLIAGLIEPSSGTIAVDGKDFTRMDPEDRHVGFVFQHFEIFPSMTVYENVSYGLSVRGYSENIVDATTMRALALVKLDDKALAMPASLSTPELQKVGLARAIATRSKILFLDEPLGKLDPKIRKTFRHELRKLVKSLGLTAIQVTHDQEEAMAIADKIIVMRKGRILQAGTPERMYYRPETIFVANFFGETNFLEGFLSDVGPDSCTFHLRLGGPRFNINLPQAHAFKSHVQAIIGYRIEDVELLKLDEGNGEREAPEEDAMPELNTTRGVVKASTFIGPMKRFIVTLVNGDEVHAKHSSKLLIDFPPGEEILVGFHKNPMVFPFPADLRGELLKA